LITRSWLADDMSMPLLPMVSELDAVAFPVPPMETVPAALPVRFPRAIPFHVSAEPGSTAARLPAVL